MQDKSKWSAPDFQYISIALDLEPNNRNKLYKTLDCWARYILNFDFFEENLGLVSPPHFVYDTFVYGNMYIAIVCFPDWDVNKFEIW